MIRRIDLRGAGHDSPDYRTLVPRADIDVDAVEDFLHEMRSTRQR